MGKWELTMDPVQEWGEETEDGAVFGITLRRETVQQPKELSVAGPSTAFIQYRTFKVRRLKAATLDRLVSHLLDPTCLEPDYSRIFLSTYRTFTGTSELIEKLFQRDSLAPEVDNGVRHESCLGTLLQTWLVEYSEDFRDPPMHPSLRMLCLELRSHASLYPLAKRYETLLKKFQIEDVDNPQGCSPEGSNVSQGGRDPAWDHPGDQPDFMDFSVTSIAEQLTRFDSELFMKVVPFQCLGCVWSQRDKNESLSPTIRATIIQFNTVTNVVISSLLCRPASATASPVSTQSSASNPTQRARVIEKWIRVAQECRRLKNFSSLRAILSALQSNPIYRLRKTWAAISRESTTTFGNLCETFPDENYVLRTRDILVEDGGQPALDNISPKTSKRCSVTRQMSGTNGAVPYLGTYLTALTMLDTALPDTVQGGLINFEKRRREFEILDQIRQLQASCAQYVLPCYPQVSAWLQGQTLLSDQESYELSRQLEPPHDPSPGSSAPWSHSTLTKKLTFLLAMGEGSRKNPDQISVSSSGSSGSEMEDLTTSSPVRLQFPSSSFQNVAEPFPPLSSPDTCSPSSSSSSSQPDLSLPSTSVAPPSPSPAPTHKRSVSMTSLPLYNRQVADSCIVRVSVEYGNGNMYKSIMLTSQDKTAQVIQRALEKHHLESQHFQDFTLSQVLGQDRELLIPDRANVFYAMSTSANYDFILRRCPKGQHKPLLRSVSLTTGRTVK